MRTVSSLQQYARFPETSTSCTSPVDSMRCVVSNLRSPLSNELATPHRWATRNKEDNVLSHETKHSIDIIGTGCTVPEGHEIANGLFIGSHETSWMTALRSTTVHVSTKPVQLRVRVEPLVRARIHSLPGFE